MRFELTVGCPTPHFKCGALDLSATPPIKDTIHFLIEFRYAGIVKYLGIDYGARRIGVAVSDESAILAFPLGTIDAGPKALDEVLDIAKENGVSIAVMGESLNFKKEKNPIMQQIEKFAERLQDRGVAVVFEPEFMTSSQAERQFDKLTVSKPQARQLKGAQNHTHNDASAAAIILQAYLDRLRKSL